MKPNFWYEKKYWKKGKIVAGMDEVGRGAFAGPVVAGCVVFSSSRIAPLSRLRSPADAKALAGRQKDAILCLTKNIKIDDSKKLTAKQRELASKWIKKNCLAWGIGKATVYEINKLGIVSATDKAFRRAIKGIRSDYLLMDAFYVPYIRGLPKRKQVPIIKGDSKSVSIAASSIIAKVYRDNLMIKYSEMSQYRKYLWHKNKGYGTAEHRAIIQKYGATRLHRTLFLKLS